MRLALALFVGLMTKQQRMAEIEGHPVPNLGASTDVRWREYENAAIETSQVTNQGNPRG